MTMYNDLSKDHPVNQILAPQSKFLIGFDDVLILQWDVVAPPTPIATAKQFLDLINSFAAGRGFFDDDPKNTLDRNGIDLADFTVKKPWDQYPIVGRLLEVWDACHAYVTSVIAVSYPSDSSVQQDAALQAWIKDSIDPLGGNVRGLPETVDSREMLTEIVTSLVFRVTAHGSARLNSTANPALTFMANYPPCLQISDIPVPEQPLSRNLLTYLPTTGTIGDMVTFYFTFAFSIPYEPFIPLEGIDAPNLLHYGGDRDEPRTGADRISTADPESHARS